MNAAVPGDVHKSYQPIQVVSAHMGKASAENRRKTCRSSAAPGAEPQFTERLFRGKWINNDADYFNLLTRGTAISPLVHCLSGLRIARSVPLSCAEMSSL